jgi:hypothetical protein
MVFSRSYMKKQQRRQAATERTLRIGTVAAMAGCKESAIFSMLDLQVYLMCSSHLQVEEPALLAILGLHWCRTPAYAKVPPACGNELHPPSALSCRRLAATITVMLREGVQTSSPNCRLSPATRLRCVIGGWNPPPCAENHRIAGLHSALIHAAAGSWPLHQTPGLVSCRDKPKLPTQSRISPFRKPSLWIAGPRLTWQRCGGLCGPARGGQPRRPC